MTSKKKKANLEQAVNSHITPKEEIKNLEKEILSQTKDKFENIKPIIEDILKRNIGLSISELNNDITTKLHENPLINYNLNTNLKLKDAKKEFKKEFIKRVLSMNYGNISEVAKQIDVNRKTIHRLVEDYEIKNIRSFMEKPYSIKERAIGQVIENVLEGYKEFIHPNKLEDIYGNIPSMTEDLIQTIPIKELTLEEAEEIFEKKFMTKVLNPNEILESRVRNNLSSFWQFKNL